MAGSSDNASPSRVIEKILPTTLATYRTRAERVAIRCALGDAAALCDCIAGQIAIANRGRGGKGAVTKRGSELEAMAKRCADAIWQMRLAVPASDE
jgi:hypothetical protein